MERPQSTQRRTSLRSLGLRAVRREIREPRVGALDMFNVPQHEKDQLLGALAPMKTDIVEKP